MIGTTTRRPGESAIHLLEGVRFYNFATEVFEDVACDSGYPKLTVTDHDGTVKVTAQPMTLVGTNDYIYKHDILADAVKGFWLCDAEMRYTTGGNTYIEHEVWGFEVI